jgi:exodeoxyribonuclease VII large subunit
MPSSTRTLSPSTVETGAPNPLTVDAAVLTLSPRFTTDRPLTVAGKVMEVRSQYAKWHYVTLAGNDAKITVRVQKDLPPPKSHQNVVVHGVLSVQPSKFEGLEVILTGTLVGQYKTLSAPASGLSLERTHTPVRIPALLYQDQVPRIAALCTNTGAKDAQGACTNMGVPAPWTPITVSFGNKEAMIASIQKVGGDPSCAALAVLRGGGDAKSLEMWDDPDVVEALLALGKPFYTALGHSTNVLLADRFADECFDTPTAFGSAVGQLLAQQRSHTRTLDELRRLCGSLRAQGEERQATFQSQLAQVREDLGRERTRADWMKLLSIALGAALALLILYLASG